MLSIAIMAEPPQKPMYHQNKGGGYNKGNIENMKIAFLTKHLALTELQAPAFWPIYNKYEEEKKALRKGSFGEDKMGKSIDEITDADADKLVENYFLLKTKELELSKKYMTDFKKVLDSKQVAKLITSEKQFKGMLMKYGQNKTNGPNNSSQKPQIQPIKPAAE